MINDVIFDNKISAYDDWNIVLVKSEIPLPTVKTSTVDIKGADGLLDLSNVLTGDIKYNNRTVKLTFELLDDVDYNLLISKISNYLHGKNITFVISNDDTYYYTGRASINSCECNKRKGKIVISVNCNPYKYNVRESVITVSLKNETKVITLKNQRKTICPDLVVTGTITLIINGVEYELQEGEQQLLNFTLREGDNIVKVKGTGAVKISYRMGCL